MPEQQLKAFLEAIKGDTDLQERLMVSTGLETIEAIATEAGFTLSAADVVYIQEAIESFDDDELEQVAGGAKKSFTELVYDFLQAGGVKTFPLPGGVVVTVEQGSIGVK
jgi:predicted ribosomally synthesized peptide with nif11-like leader